MTKYIVRVTFDDERAVYCTNGWHPMLVPSLEQALAETPPFEGAQEQAEGYFRQQIEHGTYRQTFVGVKFVELLRVDIEQSITILSTRS